ERAEVEDLQVQRVVAYDPGLAGGGWRIGIQIEQVHVHATLVERQARLAIDHAIRPGRVQVAIRSPARIPGICVRVGGRAPAEDPPDVSTPSVAYYLQPLLPRQVRVHEQECMLAQPELEYPAADIRHDRGADQAVIEVN